MWGNPWSIFPETPLRGNRERPAARCLQDEFKIHDPVRHSEREEAEELTNCAIYPEAAARCDRRAFHRTDAAKRSVGDSAALLHALQQANRRPRCPSHVRAA